MSAPDPAASRWTAPRAATTTRHRAIGNGPAVACGAVAELPAAPPRADAWSCWECWRGYPRPLPDAALRPPADPLPDAAPRRTRPRTATRQPALL